MVNPSREVERRLTGRRCTGCQDAPGTVVLVSLGLALPVPLNYSCMRSRLAQQTAGHEPGTGQPLHSGHKADALQPAHQLDDVAALPTAEAIECARLGIHREARARLTVERAEPHEVGADPSEGEVICHGDLLNGAGAQDGPSWMYSLEAAPNPNAAHAGGGPGGQGTGTINVNAGADPYLVLDPGLSSNGVGGINQLLAYIADQAGAVLPFHAEISYSPLYLYPR